MKLDLLASEKKLLEKENIIFDSNHDYSEDEALMLLDQVREIEIGYSLLEDMNKREKVFQYGKLADKIQTIIDNS